MAPQGGKERESSPEAQGGGPLQPPSPSQCCACQSGSGSQCPGQRRCDVPFLEETAWESQQSRKSGS